MIQVFINSIQLLLTSSEITFIALDGNLFISDSSNRRVRKMEISSKTVSTIAGSGSSGDSGDGGGALSAQFTGLVGVLLGKRKI